MTIKIGNASAPRWYDLSSQRLEEYLALLLECGATSTELVLHRGEADDATRRVHILEEDWFSVFERYRAHGLICHAHAPLHPRFKLDRWRDDPDGLKTDLLPVINAAAAFTERQGAPCVLVLHGASGPDAEDTTARFLIWASKATRDVRLSLELRNPKAGVFAAFDRTRSTLAAFVEWMEIEHLGICWDIAHDWESQRANSRRIAEPAESFLKRVNHVHLHDAGGDGDLTHYALQSGRIPWQTMLDPLIERGYAGAITMEIRYRLALAMGDPWEVLGGSYSLLSSYLRREPGSSNHSDSLAAPF